MAQHQPLRPLEERAQSKLPLILVGVLIMALIVVIFVLPKSVGKPESLEDKQRASELLAARQEPSPLAVAEQRKARSEAQKILKQLLPIREKLTELSVDVWAASEFQAALSEVETGERLYARGKYVEALSSYQKSFDQLQAIDQGIPERVLNALSEGNIALNEDDAETAVGEFERVLLMQPGQSEAELGLARAKTLPLTMPLWRQAQINIENTAWTEARQNLEGVLEYDANFPQAKETLNTVKAKLTNLSFTELMSQGFSALASGRLEEADRVFRQASKIKPKSEEVASALAQVETEKTNRAIARDLANAKQFEESEQWQKAVGLYDNILKQHPSIAEVKAARIPASIRARIDDRFQAVISKPLKLGNFDSYRGAARLLDDMKSIQQPGPKLSQQITQLSETMQRSQTPVQITLLSDNETNVEIFRIGQFGALTEKTLQLTPGHYVAAGNRNGYRDVQIKFTIDGLSQLDPIEVICTEPI